MAFAHSHPVELPLVVATVCDKCKNNPAEPQHPCPFLSDVHDDEDTLCNCCDTCVGECSDAI